jgi:hypothetical protein
MDTNRMVLAVVGITIGVGVAVWFLFLGLLSPNATDPRLQLFLLAYVFLFPLLLLAGGGVLLWFTVLRQSVP